jgi:DNA-3-methyladenine glycosylase
MESDSVMRNRKILSGHAVDVAPLILGAIVSTRVAGRGVSVRISEVEAYGGIAEDPGSHAHRRKTPRNTTMFGPAGHCYEYFTYGIHWMINVVTRPSGTAGAVLLRAGTVVEGIPVAQERRPTARTLNDLARGPARLASALGASGGFDGLDMLSRQSSIRLDLAEPVEATRIGTSARTGVAGAGALTPWRFFILDEQSVSPYRAATPRQREITGRPSSF